MHSAMRNGLLPKFKTWMINQLILGELKMTINTQLQPCIRSVTGNPLVIIGGATCPEGYSREISNLPISNHLGPVYHCVSENPYCQPQLDVLIDYLCSVTGLCQSTNSEL